MSKRKRYVKAPTNFRICEGCGKRVEWSAWDKAPEGWKYVWPIGKLCPDCQRAPSREASR